MRLRWHYLGVAILAAIVCLLFLREPGFGDDLTYWAQGMEMHELGAKSIERGSFHDLRWPVWGVCWAIQGVMGLGVSSFYGEPLLYMILGALLAFSLGNKLLKSPAAGWAAAIGFLYHPLLDTVCYRPMPDLSEGVLGAAAMACWWAAMNAENGRKASLWAIATGFLVYVVESNRVTGAFIVPILIANTLAFFPRKFGWLVVAGVVAAGLYAGEMVVYHGLFGDWFHNINANMNNAGNKGTEPIPVWTLPFRFLDALWEGNPLTRPYGILMLIGIPMAWKRLGTLGRVVVVWFVLLFLEYSCMPQPKWPIRPLLRDADRFLAALAIPMSLLVICGFWWVGEKLQRWRLFRIPAAVLAVVAVIAMWAVTSREHFELGFVPEFRAYLRALPPGTKIFTHQSMRAIAFLCDSEAAKKLTFFAPPRILYRNKLLEKQAAECAEFWYARKLVWLSERKQLERKELPKQPALGTYFDEPEREWTLVRLLAKGDTPDLIFYRRRTPDSPAPKVFDQSAAEFAELVPALPQDWKRESEEKSSLHRSWSVPESYRGKLARLEAVAGSPQVEAITLRMRFRHGNAESAEYLLKPYLHPEGGKDFFAFTIPADADQCDFTLKFSSKAKQVHFENFRLVLSEP